MHHVKCRNVFYLKVFDHPEEYPKLTSSKHSFGGYPYWLKFGCNVNDVVFPLKVPKDETFNEESLKNLTAQIISRKLFKSDAVLWDVHVSKVPLQDLSNNVSY